MDIETVKHHGYSAHKVFDSGDLYISFGSFHHPVQTKDGETRVCVLVNFEDLDLDFVFAGEELRDRLKKHTGPGNACAKRMRAECYKILFDYLSTHPKQFQDVIRTIYDNGYHDGRRAEHRSTAVKLREILDVGFLEEDES